MTDIGHDISKCPTKCPQIAPIPTWISYQCNKLIIDMFENLFRIAMEKFESTLYRREAHEAAPHVIAKTAASPIYNDDPELIILAEKYGELEPGKQIQVPPHDALVSCADILV